VVDPMAIGFTVTGLAAGDVLGWLQDRTALLVCLGLAVLAVAGQIVLGAQDRTWGTMYYWLLAGLTTWATLLALTVVALFAVVRVVRQRRDRAAEEDRR
jgi:uncharacterized membrane protein